MYANAENSINAVPKVSVTVVTYNHGEWLAQCLESIVTQKTNFIFEVIVGDDASTDKRTTEILHEYARQNPKILIPIFREKNVGPVKNLFDVTRRSRGKYIAYIDGDDFMLPGKLQKQVDCLDAHDDVAIAAHKMCSVVDDKCSDADLTKKHPEIGTVYDLLRHGCYFCHSSKMYRRSVILTRDSELPIVDYYLHLEHAISGKIYFSEEILGGHRLHAQGISKDKKYRQFIRDAYERAYDRALELNLSQKAVERGRIRHRHAIALSSLVVGDLDLFQAEAKIEKKLLSFASAKQLVLHNLSFLPTAAKFLFRMRNLIKTIK